MEAKRTVWLLLLLPLVFMGFFTNIVCGDAFHNAIINSRLAWDVNQSIFTPYYAPNGSGLSQQELDWAQGGYALACLYANKTNPAFGSADSYIHGLCTLTLSDSDCIYAPVYWALPSLYRMYLDTTLNGRMSATSRTDIRGLILKWVKPRSKLKTTYTNASSSTWYVTNTENHDIVLKSSFLLGCQALDDATDRNTVLNDGNTVDQHYQGWRKYFYEFFRQRAREGLNLEVASQTYAMDDLEGIYNICDYAADPNLRALAKDYLTLYWADYANDFLPATGLRGASGTRWYKYGLTCGEDSLQDLLYAYDWHDNYPYAGKTSPQNVLFYTSPYRIPDIVRLAGATAIRNPYLSTTRRFGKGCYAINVGDDINVVYKLDANNVSDIRRDTWWTKDYVMGGLSLRTDNAIYTHVFDQNRAMGILFATDMDDRMIFDGNGTMGPDKGYTEITGVCGKNCLVGARDKNATFNNGVNIFIHDGPLHTNLRYDANNGWNFTKTGPYGGVDKMFVADADANDPTRNNELLLGDKTASPSSVPSLVPGGISGKAIQFVKSSPGVGNVAYATKKWLRDYNSVSVDLYFKSSTKTDSNDQILANVPMVWQVYLNGNNVKLLAYNGLSYHSIFVPGVSLTRWQHLIASVNKNGYMQLSVDANSATPWSFVPMTKPSAPTDIVLGNKPGYTRWYNGLMDNVRINCPDMPGSPLVGGWNMDSSYTKDVYVAFRIANKTGANYYSTTSTVPDANSDPGIKLAFTDMYAPVVFEVNSATGLTYSAFQIAVKANNATRWVWDGAGKHLTYISLAGTKYEYWGNSGNLPKIGIGTTVNINLDPNKTFDCNTLQGYHGRDTRTIMHSDKSPDHNDLVLNFNYTTSPNWDDYQTIALWHMDTIQVYQGWLRWVDDDYLEHPGRNNALVMYNRANQNTVAGPMSSFANAVAFDGSNQYGQAVGNPNNLIWQSYNTVKVDLWFKAGATSGNHTLVDANNAWEIRQEGSNLKFYVVWAPPYYVNSATINCITDMTTWHHVTATCDAAGNMKLTVDGTTVSGSGGLYPCPMQSLNTGIYVGQLHNGQYFNGCLDDIKISKYSIP